MRSIPFTVALARTPTAPSIALEAATLTPPAPRAQRGRAWGAATLALVAGLALAVFMHTRLDRELSELSAPERQSLYERTLVTLRTTCAQAHGAEVVAYCRRQADFITHFPECDRECRDLAARFAARPSR